MSFMLNQLAELVEERHCHLIREAELARKAASIRPAQPRRWVQGLSKAGHVLTVIEGHLKARYGQAPVQTVEFTVPCEGLSD
jgi:hypothetical protein